jgi:hypothetical protein
MIITSTQIVQMCTKLSALSSNQAGLVTADFLSFANLIMSVLTSELLAAREEYLIYQESLAVVTGDATVRVPYRAVNGEIRHLWFEDSTGARTRLDARTIEDNENYNANDTGPPDGFYIMGNQIVLQPPPSLNGSLVVAYPFRPNQLVDASTTQSISVIAGNVVTVPNIPSNFITGGLFDIIDNASGNAIVYYDQVGTISGNTITFPVNVSLNAVVGNYVCQANQSPVPMLPEEGHTLLLETTVLRLEMIRGNAARIKNSTAIVTDARKAWDLLLLNRVVSKAKATGAGGQQFPLRPW